MINWNRKSFVAKTDILRRISEDVEGALTGRGTAALLVSNLI